MTGLHDPLAPGEGLNEDAVESRERLQEFADSLPQIAWSCAANGAVEWFNRRYYEYTGVPPGSGIGWGWSSIFHPDDLAAVIRGWTDALTRGHEYLGEGRLRRHDGAMRWFQIRTLPLRDPDGQPLRWHGTATDIDDRRQAEEALAQSEARFRDLADNMSQMAWIADGQGAIFWLNRRWLEFTGSSLEDSQGWNWRHFHHPKYVARVEEAYRQAILTGEAGEATFPLRGADGRYRWFLSRVMPLHDAEGRVVRWFGTNTDVTEEREAVFALQASEHRLSENLERLRALSSASLRINAAAQTGTVLATVTEEARRLIPAHQAAGVSLHDDDWQKVFMHRSFSDRYAAELDHAVGVDYRSLHDWLGHSGGLLRLSPSEVGHHPQLSSFAAQHQPPLRGLFATTFTARDGMTLGLLLLSDRMEGDFTADDEAVLRQLAATAGVAIENSRLYIARREADRRKDEFIATLAHELRNPLAPIISCIELIQKQQDSQTMDHCLRVMERQAGHMAHLLGDLLDVSRITRGNAKLQAEIFDLRTVIHDALDAIEVQRESLNHEIAMGLPDDELLVQADRLRLTQVFTNLLDNAVKYTPAGGKLTLLVQREGEMALVRIADTGIGIPKHMLPRVFDLFAQVDRNLRGSQDGLGVGLAIVKTLVGMHGGTVTAHSDGAGLGSEFEVRLRLHSQDHSGTPVQPAEASDLSDLSGPILIVDDNRDAADSLGMVVEMLGGRAAVFYDGETALAGVDDVKPGFALVDLGMPGMNGFELARRLRRHPLGASMRIIALSGWGQPEDRERSRKAGFDAHVVKPVDVHILTAVLRGNSSDPGGG